MTSAQITTKPVPFRVGLLSFSDGRQRVHETLADAVRRNQTTLADAIERDPLLVAIPANEIIHSIAQAKTAATEMRAGGVEAAVFNIPVFAFPNYSLMAARLLDLPVLLNSPKDPTLPGLGGIMAAHGAMTQIGLRAIKMWGNPLEDPPTSKHSLSALPCVRRHRTVKRKRFWVDRWPQYRNEHWSGEHAGVDAALRN